MTGKSPTWFITGASSGFGNAFAKYALNEGYNVVATARNPDKLVELVERDPKKVLAIQVDVTKPNEIQSAITQAIEMFGCIDVLLNNAGYGIIGAIEETPEDEIRAQMETNFFGAILVIQQALPIMRKQGFGSIVNISSMGGAMSFPGVGIYSASKFALEGASEALQQEVAPFGIKVLIVEPGNFRTNFARPGVLKQMPKIDAYNDIVGGTRDFSTNFDGQQMGDPMKAADAVDIALKSEKTPLRLQLGQDAVDAVRGHAESMLEEIKAWEAVGSDTRIDE